MRTQPLHVVILIAFVKKLRTSKINMLTLTIMFKIIMYFYLSLNKARYLKLKLLEIATY